MHLHHAHDRAHVPLGMEYLLRSFIVRSDYSDTDEQETKSIGESKCQARVGMEEVIKIKICYAISRL